MTCPTAHVCVYFCNWIKPPHDKIALCICDTRNWFFWFNSKPALHGHGQLPVASGEHSAITKDCFLDLSGLRSVSADELAKAQMRGAISDALKARIVTALSVQIKPLPDAHRIVALNNLQ
jgi:hypothetical protein